MNNKLYLFITLFGIIILFSNLPPLRYLLDYIIDEKHITGTVIIMANFQL